MSLDFLQVSQQVQQLGETAVQRQRERQDRLRDACALLAQHAAEIEALRQKVQGIVSSHDPTLRCALPVKEALNARFPLPPAIEPITLIAADGSQIFADRHAEVEYCLVNTGAIWMHTGSAEAPVTSIRSRLIYADQLEGMSDERLSLQRDLAERMRLLELASQARPPVITLTDGPLEIWTTTLGEGHVAGEFRKSLEAYLDVLRGLHQLGSITAGYVDKPGADLVVRLLEVARAAPEDLQAMRAYRPLKGVTDIELFHGLLQPGDRSAVFGIQARSVAPYRENLALHFFYLNVGRTERPYLARVEIPAWVAVDAAMLDALQAVLVQQSAMLGAEPYPYLLHRAHETALVSLEDKQQVTEMIVHELRRRGLDVAGPSAKQYNKDVSGKRTRYVT
ncbi:MAG: DNA double-strand break repair nuclease NurA [Acidobacteriaceae bacterium]